MSTDPTRRAVLAAGLVGAGLVGLTGLTGCTGDDRPSGRASRPAGPDPDAVVTAAVVADKQATLRVYDAVIAAHPAVLAGPLAPYVADHAAHLRALGGAPASPTPGATPASAAPASTTPPSETPTSSASPDPSASPTPSLIAVPDRPDDALALLVSRELAASARRGEQIGAVSAELARLLGSIAAAEAVHVALLPDALDEPAA